MRSLKLPLVALSLLALCACTTSSLTEQENAPVTGSETTFMGTMKEIDKELSVISFTGKSNIINHEGKFTEYTATVSLDPAEPANLEKAMITAEVDVTSALTEAAGLNAHLQKEDFFAANQYPKAMFTSTRIVSKGGNLYDVTGDLILKGVMKEISLAAEITDDYLTTHYDLPRKDFGIGNDSYGDKLLEETVPVKVKLVFKK